MNKNQNKRNCPSYMDLNTNSYVAIWKTVFAVKRVSLFDFFQQTSCNRDKLQIIYANIRVWNL